MKTCSISAFIVGAVLHAQIVALESRIVRQIRPIEDDLAEGGPLAVVLNAEDDLLAVAQPVRPVGRDGRVARTGPGRSGPAHGVVHRVPHPLPERLEQRDFERGALPGALALQERRQNAGVGVHAAGDVRDRQTHLRRRVRRAGDRYQADFTLHQQVVGFLGRVGTGRSVAAQIAHDHPWISARAALACRARDGRSRRARGSARRRPTDRAAATGPARASGRFRSSVSDSFDRFSQTKWLASPWTVVS